jgi:hypothetical protein
MDTSSSAAASSYRPSVSSDSHSLPSTGDNVMNAPDGFFLPDIQASVDLRHLAIHRPRVVEPLEPKRAPLNVNPADAELSGENF